MMQSVWIFQANPDRYDILNSLADPECEMGTWTINRYRDKIKKGDISLIWKSGRKDSGIYALSEVLSEPAIMFDFPAVEKYWLNEKDKGKKQLRVINKLTKKLVNNPILKNELEGIPGLQNLSILRFAQSTNFPVSKDEWVIIENKIEEHSGFWGHDT